MKITSSEKSYLLKILNQNLESIEQIESDLSEEEKQSFEFEEMFEDKESIENLIAKIKDVKEPGASTTQLTKLEKIAEQKKKQTKDKIISIMDSMLMFDTKITISSVSKQSGLVYNTVKRFKSLIQEKEELRKTLHANNTSLAS